MVVPYSCPRELIFSAKSPCISVGSGPWPTRVMYAFTTPSVRVILSGLTPLPVHAPPAIGWEEVTKG